MNTGIGTFRSRGLDGIAKLAVVLVSAFAPLAIFESPVQAQSALAQFDVASVKQSGASSSAVLNYSPSGRFSATGLTLKRVIMWAYNLGTPAISGGPGWLDSDKYDILAEVPSGSITGPVGAGMALDGDKAHGMGWTLASDAPGGRQLRSMVQNLLADRFQLKVHSEPREIPVYNLVIAKNGPKFRESQSESAPRVSFTMGRLSFQNAPLTFLITLLTELSGRTVVNATSLTAQYDFSLNWTPDQNLRREGGASETSTQADSSAPSLLTALQEQLGLKLAPAKAPLEVLVIDHIEKPSAN